MNIPSKTWLAARKPSIVPALFGMAALFPAGWAAAGDGFELRGDAHRGAPLYARHCASCHGNTGAGDGPAAGAFDPPPSDLTGVEPDPGRFYRATRDGGMAVGLTAIMPAFERSMSDDEIHDVVAYLLSLND